MRIFKYWIEHSQELTVGSTKQLSKVFGGSNISEAHAIQDAKNKLHKAQQIIDREISKDEGYEADILEEIIDTIDHDNIITRNRYGALVLNSKKVMFIDVDDYSKTLSDAFFRSKLSKKQLMLRKIEKTAKQQQYAKLGFRVYETHKGYRILVTNKEFDPRSKESKRMMRDFNADYLYRWLCIKQNCYRARLTPKPYRIKQKGIKVIYPHRDNEQEQQLARWVKDYNQKSQRFSTCHLVAEYGTIQKSAAIDYHDKHTGVTWSNKLA